MKAIGNTAGTLMTFLAAHLPCFLQGVGCRVHCYSFPTEAVTACCHFFNQLLSLLKVDVATLIVNTRR